jgi:hypothetical protein
VILLYRAHALVGLLAIVIYAYFAVLSGFTFWQGSRIMYPAQYAWILPAVLVWERISQRLTLVLPDMNRVEGRVIEEQ